MARNFIAILFGTYLKGREKIEELEIRIDTCCSKTMMGHKFYQDYLLNNNIDESELKKQYCREAHSFSETVWRAREKVTIPLKLKNEWGGEKETIWIDVLIMEGKVPFLLGEKDQTNLDFNLKLGKRT